MVFEYQISCSLLDKGSFSQQPHLKAFRLAGGLGCANGLCAVFSVLEKKGKKKEID